MSVDDIKTALACDALLGIAVEQKNVLIEPYITIISLVGPNLHAIKPSQDGPILMM